MAKKQPAKAPSSYRSIEGCPFHDRQQPQSPCVCFRLLLDSVFDL